MRDRRDRDMDRDRDRDNHGSPRLSFREIERNMNHHRRRLLLLLLFLLRPLLLQLSPAC
jgi:hypothetical protein